MKNIYNGDTSIYKKGITKFKKDILEEIKKLYCPYDIEILTQDKINNINKTVISFAFSVNLYANYIEKYSGYEFNAVSFKNISFSIFQPNRTDSVIRSDILSIIPDSKPDWIGSKYPEQVIIEELSNKMRIWIMNSFREKYYK